MADRFLLQISRKWRIAEDRLQWILQRCNNDKRYADDRPHPRNWRGHSFCRTRKALVRCIGEHVRLGDGEDSSLIEAAVARVQTWPEWHRPRQEPLAGVAIERPEQDKPAEQSAA